MINKQLRNFFGQQILADVSSIEKHGNSFDDFFIRYFDPHNSGFANLASILNAFHDTIEIKISFDQVILLCLNAVVDYEHFLNSELARLYKSNEIIRGQGFTYEILETALQQISTNYANIK